MNKVKAVKRVMKYVWIVWGIMTALVLFHFLIHGNRIYHFNQKVRHLTADSTATEAEVKVQPRGQKTDSWEKNDAFVDVILYAQIYDITISNHAECLMKDWSLRINIKEDCYLNSAWCGTVEIHQSGRDGEKVQTLNLRNYKASEVSLDYTMSGQDLLIPLHRNDYLIYHPDTSKLSGEVPLKGAKGYSGNVIIGFILYNTKKETDLSDYKLTYQLEAGLFSGIQGITFAILLIILALLGVFLLVVSAIILRFEDKLFKQEQVMKEALDLCAMIADSKDMFCKGHSVRVAKYSRILAEQIGMAKKDCDIVYFAAMLHDIGNYYVPEQILGKQGRLSKEEMDMVKSHTTKGAMLLTDLQAIPYAMEVALFHHEWFDGSGYPMGKKGEEIPLIARLVSVAEVYEAMSHHRAYRMKLTEKEILDEMRKQSGIQFDPVVMEAFFEAYDTLKGVAY